MNGAKNLSASLRRYLAAIRVLGVGRHSVRAGEIAEKCCVNKSSVTAALRSLAELSLVEYKPYGAVSLTETGIQRADEIVERLTLMKNFLMNALRLDERDADHAAAQMEFSATDKVMLAIERGTGNATNKDDEVD